MVSDISGVLAPMRRDSDDEDNDFIGGFDDADLSPPPAPLEDLPEVNEELQALPEDDAQLAVGLNFETNLMLECSSRLS